MINKIRDEKQVLREFIQNCKIGAEIVGSRQENGAMLLLKIHNKHIYVCLVLAQNKCCTTIHSVFADTKGEKTSLKKLRTAKNEIWRALDEFNIIFAKLKINNI